MPLIARVTDSYDSIATTSLISILYTITSIVEPFALGAQSIDFNLLPPFVTFLVYKAATLLTERLWIDGDSNEGLRKFLAMVGERWFCGGEWSKTFQKWVMLTEFVQSVTLSFLMRIRRHVF